ncbi:unnamed protein product [Sympodiomycopsis kandeliae]
MATSLASQLSGIRSLNAARLASSSALSSQSSYLFPPRTAAGQDLETIYSLGETGWNELCIEDASLEKWSGSEILFGIQAKDTDRTQLSKEENAQLNVTIEGFFQRVGAILLHKSTAKCIEWLVRRFRIHEFNSITVLRAFFPFHQTPQFARMLHILNLSSESHLAFLYPMQKTTQPLPTSVLLSALLAPSQSSRSLDTLRFVTSILPSDSAPHRAQIVFWSSILVQFCARSAGVDAGSELSMGLASSAKRARGKSTLQQRQDNAQLVLSIILPAAIDVVRRRKGGLELQLAGCLVVSAIGASFDLSSDAVASTVFELAGAAADSRREGRLVEGILAATASLCASLVATESEKAITPQALTRFLYIDSIQQHLTNLAKQFDLSVFLRSWLHALADNAEDNEKARNQLVATLLASKSAQNGVSPALSQSIIEKLLLTPPKPSAKILEVLSSLRQQKAPSWDAAVRKLTGDKSESKQHFVNVIRDVTRTRIASSSSSAEDAESAASWIDLNASEASQRAIALESLVSSISEAGSDQTSDAFIREGLLARIADDDLRVLEILYANDAKALLQAVPSSDAILKAVEVACTPSADLSRKILKAHLDFLLGPFLSKYPKASNRVLRNILWPRLLIVKANRKAAEVTRTAIQEAFTRKEEALQPFFAQLSGVSKDSISVAPEQTAKFNADLVQGLAEAYKDVQSESHWNAHVSFLFSQVQDSTSNLSVTSSGKALALLTLGALLRLVQANRFSSIAQRLLRDSRTASLAIPSSAPAIKAQATAEMWSFVHDHTARAHDFLLARALLDMTSSLQLSTSNAAHLLGIGELASPSTDSHVAIARGLYQQANSDSQNVIAGRELLAALFSQLGESAATFLAGVWIQNGQGNEMLSLAALRHLRVLLSAYSSDASLQCSDFQALLPTLLLATANEHVNVRKEAAQCVRLVTQLAKAGAEKPSQAQIWGYDGVYGPGSEALKYLDCPSTYRFCFEIMQHADALVNDADYLSALLGGTLTTLKGQDKHEVAFRRSTLSYLLSHIEACPVLNVKFGLLQALSRVQDSTKLPPLLPLITKAVESGKAGKISLDYSLLQDDLREEYFHLLFDNFDKRSKIVLHDSATGAWQLLLDAIASRDEIISRNATLGLKNVYSVLQPELRKVAVEELAKILADPTFKAPKEIRETLSSLDIDPSILVLLLVQLRNSLTETSLGSPSAKKARTVSAPSEVSSTTITVLTELLESCLGRNMPPIAGLISELFEILRTVIELHTARTFNGDYLLHLTMSNLTKQLESASRTGDVVQSLRVDTVINVVKASSNPSTFQQALLLLSSMANLGPETVIHSAMPIFTFVGSTILQRDDAFSFTVVERVLKSIIPPLVQHLFDEAKLKIGKDATAEEKRFEILKAARPFLCIFTDSATHIPRHRRQNFFQLLMWTLGSPTFVPGLCMLLVDRASHKVSRQTSENALSTLQLPLAVFSDQNIDPMMSSLNDIWSEAERLWKTRDVDPTESDQDVFLSRLSRVRSEHGEKRVDARAQIISLLSFITAAVKTTAFLSALGPGASNPVEHYHTFITYSLRMQDYEDESIAEHANEAMSAIMAIAPAKIFMGSIQRLLKDQDGKMANKALDLVASRLSNLSAADRAVVAEFSAPVLAAVSEKIKQNKNEKELSSAFGALDAISTKSQDVEQSSLGAMLPGLVGVLENSKTSDVTRARGFVILRNLAGSLGPRLIAHLKRIVTLCVDSVTRGTFAASIALSLDTLSKLFVSVPSFMEPFIGSVVGMAVNPAIKGHVEGSAAVGKSSNSFMSTLIKKTPSDKILTATFGVWKTAEHATRLNTLGFLQRILRVVDRNAIQNNYKAVFRFLIQVLDGRRENRDLPLAQIRAIEDSAIKAFTKLVMKLNETSFRPLFLRIFDWAALDLADDDLPMSDDGLVARRIALYKVNNALQDQLKGLISHYYSTVLELTIELMEGYRDGQMQNAELWFAITSSVEKSARYDEGTFWNPARLQKLTPAFVGQLSMRNKDLVENLGGSEEISKAITPAVTNIARVVPDEASLKVINGSLLTQLRQDVIQVRVATLNVLTDMWSESSLSHVLLGLVPETVPHIAELMEVDETEVVEATRGFVTAVEGVLGESLESYLQ